MPSYHGLVATLTKGTSTGGEFAVLTGVSTSTVVASVPAKFMNRALFSVNTTGISGTYSAHVVSQVGGATFVIAGATGIAANGGVLFGASTAIVGVARPAYVEWASAEDDSGFVSSVIMTGDY